MGAALSAIAQRPPSAVTPLMQSVATGAAVEEWNIENEPIPDRDRQVPNNFLPSAHAAYLRLPEACLPQHPGNGKKNFTLTDSKGAKIEVMLAECKFFIKKLADGSKASIPGVPFSLGMAEAWRLVQERAIWQP